MPSLLIMKIHDSSFPFQKQIREFSDITLQSYKGDRKTQRIVNADRIFKENNVMWI